MTALKCISHIITEDSEGRDLSHRGKDVRRHISTMYRRQRWFRKVPQGSAYVVF